MATKLNATIKAVENADHWMGGAVVVVEEDGSYEAIPGAYLTDISYTGSREIVVNISNGLDDTGYNVDGATAEDIAEMLLADD